MATIGTMAGKKVVLRADGSHALGMGHIVRCLALSHSFRDAGWDVGFITKGDPHAAPAEFIREQGLDVQCVGPETDVEADAEHTADLLTAMNANAVVVDLSHREFARAPKQYAGFLSKLRKAGCYTVLVEGLGEECISSRVSVEADMVVVPYAGAANAVCALPKARYLLGPEYAIFRDEFIKSYDPHRETNPVVKKLLVTMGGSDPAGLTVHAAKALAALPLQGVELTVVLGPHFSESHKQQTEQALANCRADVNFANSPPDIATLFASTDVAIISDGLTKYEAALLGTPAVVLSQDEFQKSLSKAFVSLGCCLQYGPDGLSDAQALGDVIQSLISDLELRRRMSQIGLRIMDAKGGGRIVREISKELLHASKN